MKGVSNKFITQQEKEVKAEDIEGVDYKCKCTAQFYIILTLSITMIGLIIFEILQLRRIKLCRGQLFSNIVKIMFFYIQCTVLPSSKIVQDSR